MLSTGHRPRGTVRSQNEDSEENRTQAQSADAAEQNRLRCSALPAAAQPDLGWPPQNESREAFSNIIETCERLYFKNLIPVKIFQK